MTLNEFAAELRRLGFNEGAGLPIRMAGGKVEIETEYGAGGPFTTLTFSGGTLEEAMARALACWRALPDPKKVTRSADLNWCDAVAKARTPAHMHAIGAALQRLAEEIMT